MEGRAIARLCRIVGVESRRIDIEVITLFAHVDALTASEQVVGTIRVATFSIALVVERGVPHIVPKHIVLAIRWVVGIGRRSIAIIGPAETRHSEGAIETWVAVHEWIVGIVSILGSRQFGIGFHALRNLTISHGEHIYEHSRSILARATSILRTDAVLPVVI